MQHRASLAALAAQAAPLGAVCLVFASSVALAHPGHEEATFASALVHPWSGWDHMLAMVAVGAAAASRRARGGLAMLAAPLAFMAAMTLGAVAAWGGLSIAWAEAGILASLAAAAGLVFFAHRLPLSAVIGLAALAGLPHGAAHGGELSAGVAVLAGFLASTAALHGLGLAAGLALLRRARAA